MVRFTFEISLTIKVQSLYDEIHLKNILDSKSTKSTDEVYLNTIRHNKSNFLIIFNKLDLKIALQNKTSESIWWALA